MLVPNDQLHNAHATAAMPKTSWTASVATVSTSETGTAADPLATPPISSPIAAEGDGHKTDESSGSPTSAPAPSTEGAGSGKEVVGSDTASLEPDNELETDSPFD